MDYAENSVKSIIVMIHTVRQLTNASDLARVG